MSRPPKPYLCYRSKGRFAWDSIRKTPKGWMVGHWSFVPGDVTGWRVLVPFRLVNCSAVSDLGNWYDKKASTTMADRIIALAVAGERPARVYRKGSTVRDEA